ncbi:FFLEELY motif protein [Ramlibacter albus]|uniref:DUF8198 domain-containing protein n=1 Tax=Ramlibacter albus TaxID=2079448 RepID=A0A923S0N1_9BURK|nr:hypothetical protein [Ramlibacter albus]MBC5763386.1 hypothetical protein [Ramlibacter albus]
MEAAQRIRKAVAEVAHLREVGHDETTLRAAVIDVKRLQARRFAGTYADMLGGGAFRAPARFFLDELYSDKDYAERDAQFARIAGAIEKFFPAQVAQTAVALAELHALTEQLDFAVAQAWISPELQLLPAPARYVHAWRKVGRRAERESQLTVVMRIGAEMARLTRTPGLRLMLKMMRGPAAAAGLNDLQRFLEAGFDTFGAMAKKPGEAERFLGTIREREAGLIQRLFEADVVACETELGSLLGQAP